MRDVICLGRKYCQKVYFSAPRSKILCVGDLLAAKAPPHGERIGKRADTV